MDQEKSKKDRHVKWDEEKLKETEKYRGTYQKINQPKTPYRANIDNSEDENEMEEEREKTTEELEIEQSLNKAQKNKETNKRGKIDLAVLNAKLKEQMSKYHEDDCQMEEEESEEKRKKQEEFKKKRAAHYNEFKRIQQAKQDKWEDSD